MNRNFPATEFCDGPPPVLGPGQSRPLPNQSTRLYRLRVKIPQKPVMTITLPAPTRGKAIMYCRNRWPGCEAEAIE
jgi:hypothetical protein